MNPLSEFAKFYREGGPFMHAILLVAVVILAIVAERLWTLWSVSAWNGRKFLDDLVQRVERGDNAGAAQLCLKAEMPVGQVARSMLAARSAGASSEAELQSAADGAAVLTLPPLARRLSQLNLLANVATLLGLLGTIFGLTTAFSAVNAADPAQRSAFLAVGIAQALNTTAFGLLVAVPTLLAHGYLAGRVEGVVEQVDEAVVRLSRALLHARGGDGRAVVNARSHEAR